MKNRETEKKPFYRKRSFIIWAIIIAIVVVMYFAVENISWFNHILGQA